MSALLRPALSAVLVAVLAGCAAAPPSSPATAGTVPASGTAAGELARGPESALRKGMTADAVRRIMGQPTEIKLMKAPSGKAETWVYHRTIRGQVEQVQVGTRSTSVATMLGNTAAAMPNTVDVPIIRQQAEVIDETINLLMFDDTLIEQQRSIQKRTEYQ